MKRFLRQGAHALSAIQINPFLQQRAAALSAGVALVRQILKENSFPNGFTTKQLYGLAQNYPPPTDFPPFVTSTLTAKKGPAVPRPEHPVRSIRSGHCLLSTRYFFVDSCNRFLKTMVLPSLEGQNEIQTVVQPRTGTHPEPDLSNLRPVRQKQRNASNKEFVWKVIPPEERRKPQPPPQQKALIGTEVGVGLDTSHLNKRRQRARVKKVTEAVLKLKGQMPFSKELNEVAGLRA